MEFKAMITTLRTKIECKPFKPAKLAKSIAKLEKRNTLNREYRLSPVIVIIVKVNGLKNRQVSDGGCFVLIFVTQDLGPRNHRGKRPGE